MVTYKFSFFFLLVENNSLIVKKSVEMASTVYKTERPPPTLPPPSERIAQPGDDCLNSLNLLLDYVEIQTGEIF